MNRVSGEGNWCVSTCSAWHGVSLQPVTSFPHLKHSSPGLTDSMTGCTSTIEHGVWLCTVSTDYYSHLDTDDLQVSSPQFTKSHATWNKWISQANLERFLLSISSGSRDFPETHRQIPVSTFSCKEILSLSTLTWETRTRIRSSSEIINAIMRLGHGT